jgi:AraC-like DNA-binding protein
MPKSTSEVDVDFVARWELERPVHYRYRVPGLQFLLPESGRLWAVVAGRRVWAEPGSLLCIPRQQLNEYGWDAPVRYWETHVSSTSPITVEGVALPAVVNLGAYAGEVLAAFAVFSQELPRGGDLARFRVRAGVWGLLAALAGALDRAPATARGDQWDAVRARLETGLGRPLPLTAVAKASGVSVDHLIRGFRRRFGVAPMAWRKQATLRHAVDLLKTGEAVKAVAPRLGFTDASAFTRAFRRQFGLSPTAYLAHGPASAPVEPMEGEGFPLNAHVRPAGETGDFAWG